MQASLLLILALTANDDRDVIQTALLSFYKKEVWHSPDWEPKQPILLLAEWGKDDGLPLDTSLTRLKVEVDDAIASLKKDRKSARNKEYLAYCETTSRELGRILPLAKQAGSFEPARIKDFRDVIWNPKVRVVDELKRDYGSGPVSARALKPRYSPNGQFAWVQFSMPWSIHSADVQFVLEKRMGQWQVRVGWARFYV